MERGGCGDWDEGGWAWNTPALNLGVASADHVEFCPWSMTFQCMSAYDEAVSCPCGFPPISHFDSADLARIQFACHCDSAAVHCVDQNPNISRPLLYHPGFLICVCRHSLFQSAMTLIRNLQRLKRCYSFTGLQGIFWDIFGLPSFGQPPNFMESVFKNARISQNLSCWLCSLPRRTAHLYLWSSERNLNIGFAFFFQGTTQRQRSCSSK